MHKSQAQQIAIFNGWPRVSLTNTEYLLVVPIVKASLRALVTLDTGTGQCHVGRPGIYIAKRRKRICRAVFEIQGHNLSVFT